MTFRPDQAWLDAQRAATADLPERPGATARLQFTVTGLDDGDVVFTTVLVDGRIESSVLGPDDGHDIGLLVPASVFEEYVGGSLDLDVGFMQGRIKVTGDIGRLLSILPVTTTDGWRAAVSAGTD